MFWKVWNKMKMHKHLPWSNGMTKQNISLKLTYMTVKNGVLSVWVKGYTSWAGLPSRWMFEPQKTAGCVIQGGKRTEQQRKRVREKEDWQKSTRPNWSWQHSKERKKKSFHHINVLGSSCRFGLKGIRRNRDTCNFASRCPTGWKTSVVGVWCLSVQWAADKKAESKGKERRRRNTQTMAEAPKIELFIKVKTSI